MDHHKLGRVRKGHKFLGGSGGMVPQKILKTGSIKTPFSALSGRNMWQNGTEKLVTFFLLLLPKKVVIR